MKSGKLRIVLGVILIVLQLISIAGNAKAGISSQLSFESLGVFVFDLLSLISYYFVGTVGVILLVSGVVAYTKGEQDEPVETVDSTPKEPEDLPGSYIPLSLSLPILGTMFVVILVIVLILERS